MNDILYLDNARLGQISPGAERAITHALEFNKAFGGSTYFMDFLQGGHDQLPNTTRFDGLKCWNGIEPLATGFQEVVFGDSSGRTCFASRSSVLVSLASQLLFRRCRNVLVSDLNWPNYGQVLETAIQNDSCRITRAPIRNWVFNDNISDDDLVAELRNIYFEKSCDGIFLPAVCNLGVKLPVEKLLFRIAEISPPRFVVLDAAQAINHIDLSWAKNLVDFTIGGTHKWLRAFEPMTVGLFSKSCSVSFIENAISRELDRNPLLDPLLNMTWRPPASQGETVNLNPLFAAAGALIDASIHSQSRNRSAVLDSFDETDWHIHEIHPTLQCNILLASKQNVSNNKLGFLSRSLAKFGVAVSDYGNGLCRFSLPSHLSSEELDKLRFALIS